MKLFSIQLSQSDLTLFNFGLQAAHERLNDLAANVNAQLELQRTKPAAVTPLSEPPSEDTPPS